MKRIFYISVTEQYQRIVGVEASDIDEAIAIVQKAANEGDVDVTDDGYQFRAITDVSPETVSEAQKEYCQKVNY